MKCYPFPGGIAVEFSQEEAVVHASILRKGAEYRVNRSPLIPEGMEVSEEDRSLWCEQMREAACESADVLQKWIRQLENPGASAVVRVPHEHAELWLITLNHARLAIAEKRGWMDRVPDLDLGECTWDEFRDLSLMQSVAILMEYWLHWSE